MKEAQVTSALKKAAAAQEVATAQKLDPWRIAAVTVYSFLTELIDQTGNYFVRQILRTARGFVYPHTLKK